VLAWYDYCVKISGIGILVVPLPSKQKNRVRFPDFAPNFSCNKNRLIAQRIGFMTHSRVTPQGQVMGKNAARLSELGRRRLESLGLVGIQQPMLRDEMCKTCACQRGTVPNGCLQTQLDFLKAVVEGKPFLCHAPKDGRMCAGWVQVRAELVANPMPHKIQELIAEWDYSPPDIQTN